MPLLSYKETIEYNGYYLHMFIKSPSYTFLRVLFKQKFTYLEDKLSPFTQKGFFSVVKLTGRV